MDDRSWSDCAPFPDTAEPTEMPDDELVEALVGFERVAAWAAARQARLLAEPARRRPPDRVVGVARTAGVAGEFAPDEVGVALHLSRGTASARLDLAARLLAVLPGAHALWEAGRIDTAKARAVHDATVVLPDALAVAVQDRVLPRAPRQTLARLRAALARAVLAVDPRTADEQHAEARRERRVVVTPESDGMASLWALLPATDAASAFTWLTRLARGLGPEDPRGVDARRADVLAALLTGRLVVDPLSGTVLDHGRTTYQPPAALADFVRIRDGSCRFPGCRRAAGTTELDHALAWADGGGTSAANPHALCLHHHLLEHHTGWRIRTHPDGRLTWITPTGHRHITRPHDHRPDPPPPVPHRAAGDEPDPPPF